jgi:hypothetical protein
MSEMQQTDPYVAEGLRRQVAALEHLAGLQERATKATETIRTLVVVLAILLVLGVGFALAALMGA